MSERARAAGAFTHPVVWLAIALLVLNDHVLKQAYPSTFTGKLSDFAGLAFFPLLLDGAIELGLAALGRYEGPSLRRLVVCIAVTGVSFALMKTTALGATVYAYGLGAARWPFAVLYAAIVGDPPAPFRLAHLVRDPTDLVALLALAIPYAIGTRRAAS